MLLQKAILILLTFVISLQAYELNVVEKKIIVKDKEAMVYAIEQPDGTQGLRLKKGEKCNVLLKNKIPYPTSVHWHGLILPNNQDGVAFITQFPIYPEQAYQYLFPIVQSGTFWMHSHVGLQEQRLLSAPLIMEDSDDQEISSQEVVIFLSDFSFTSPSAILENLRCKNFSKKMEMSKDMHRHDLVDVDYDAFLTNYRTLEDPEIVKIIPGSKVRLRIINGSSATNFFIDLGTISGEAIAVDGNRIKPFQNSIFELAVAQRIDVVVKVPEEGGFFPVLAKAEGTDRQTGLILASKDAKIPKLSEKGPRTMGGLTNLDEKQFKALHSLHEKPVQKRLIVELGGSMSTYEWTINNQAWPESTPLVVNAGERVEILFQNKSSMSHPMHLHGHIFQVTAIDEIPIKGAVRDTVLVMPNSSLAIQFDANNPGVWPLHCHILYHMEAGMFTVLRYADFQQPL